jgi:hypothetical protein
MYKIIFIYELKTAREYFNEHNIISNIKIFYYF